MRKSHPAGARVFLFFGFCAGLLALDQAAEAAPAHFVVLDSEMYLFGESAPELQAECQALVKYVNYYNARNRKPGLVSESQCGDLQAHLSFAPDQGFTLPFYSYSQDLKKEIAGKPGYLIPISAWFPEEIASRHENRPQDGVCYNTALVESGILPEAGRSVFMEQIEYFVGMNDLREISLSPDSSKMVFGPISDSPLVKWRKTYEVNAETQELVKKRIQEDLSRHFSPGSIFCASMDDLQTKETVLGLMKKWEQGLAAAGFGPLTSNADELPDDFVGERKGGHCLVMMTPNLVSESNRMLPKNLVAWELVLEYLTGLLSGTPKGGRLHYFEIDNDKAVTGDWVEKEVASSKRLQALLDLAKRHHDRYESLEWRKCVNSEQVDLYALNCWETNPEALSILRDFWKTAGSEILDSAEFSEFKKRLNDKSKIQQLRWSSDEVAYRIYGTMSRLRERLR